MLCRRCNKVMKCVMNFCTDKSYEFYRCPNCWYESKKLPFIFKDNKLNQKKIAIKLKYK